jgi:hypothetical protein|tara:strand:+ start:974 stop:1123 length:150 start_codon:yes stop_codon:yes gene_type:complete
MKGIIRIELEYDFKATTEEQALNYLENVELPDEYKVDSFEIMGLSELDE